MSLRWLYLTTQRSIAMETTHGKNQIVGFFKSRKDAEAAVVELKELGIRSGEIRNLYK